MPRLCNKEFNKNKKKEGSIPPLKKDSKFSTYKNNTINSLNEVECFLRNFNNFKKYIKLYKLLK